MAEVEPQQIGPYAITALLRKSSTSTFYRGKQRKKDLLIQWLDAPLTSSEARDAFLMRAKQLNKLKDRKIINTLDANFAGEHAYLVMEYVQGQPLQELLTGAPHPAQEVRRYLSPIAEALQYAHVHHTLHGKLHPGSILVDERNNALLTDFTLTEPGTLPSLDEEARAVPYMAPEHLDGQPTAASDQYSLAVIVYELLCGRRPYDATQRTQLRQQQEQLALPELHAFNAELSPELEQVIRQALSFKPEERFPHVQAFADNYLHVLMGIPLKPVKVASTRSRSATRQSPEKPTNGLAALPSEKLSKPEESVKRPRGTLPDKEALRLSVLSPEKDQEEAERVAAKPLPRKSTLTLVPERSAREDSQVLTAESGPGSQASRNGQETPPAKAQPSASPSSARLQAMVVADLGQGGILSRSLPGYEERSAQIEMATLVARSLTQNVPAITEASTGTGKSLAYLVPVVRSGKVAIVSTANKALQEQLFYKDIPFVQRYIKPFEAALVKGVNNYICIDRLEDERVGMQFYAKNVEFQRLLRTVADPDSGFNGDFETLGFQLPKDVRGRIATDSDQCAWSKCNFFSQCYVRLMREQAQMAQVIVVNHTLLLLDAALDGFLLPERDVVILDEAHHLEEEATRSFTITISPTQIQTLLAQRMLKDHSTPSLQDEVQRIAQNTWLRLEQIADLSYKGRTNLEEPLEEGLRLSSAIADLADSLRKQRPKDLPEKEGQLYDKLLKRTQNLSENLRVVFSVSQTNKFVYFVDRIEGAGARGGFTLQASAAPLDVTNWLKERLFNKCNVICTSATLATIGPDPANPTEKGPNFAYFRSRIGLDPAERNDVIERILPLTFDYEKNALLYLPRHLPAPTYGSGSEGYMKAIAREMYSLVKASRGRAFLLFSSRRMLEYAYALMAPHLSDFPLLKQGEMTRLELTRRFREEKGSILFGLKSFWEGVDIAGEALSLVVIDKLPFDPPDDPVHEARVALMKAAGENWFGTYVLPQAVLRLKQGLGRLLRTREDRGVMAILDTRLHTKGYGKLVLNALPPAQRTTSLKDVEAFFAEDHP
ncbi:hypothetical protein EPA93_24805 [Ktedonosporobacter rubrisoli]|uniref:Uncharacterized protein n=1 Tax=Ktedonosporobacter rubrisoli TaxID=2509675 RepID=A0A4P6JTV7_KTERU|nr:helicase C-terminal domain-containing protein [Ktedonosporobacter rubrisoli]QBD79028.1 hypothetical protein EPA93_24805 [Ktedonosporobacter rubrisoli]